MDLIIKFEDEVYQKVKETYIANSVRNGDEIADNEFDTFLEKRIKRMVKNEIVGIRRDILESENGIKLNEFLKSME